MEALVVAVVGALPNLIGDLPLIRAATNWLANAASRVANEWYWNLGAKFRAYAAPNKMVSVLAA